MSIRLRYRYLLVLVDIVMEPRDQLVMVLEFRLVHVFP